MKESNTPICLPQIYDMWIKLSIILSYSYLNLAYLQI